MDGVSILEFDCNRPPTSSVLGYSAALRHSVISPLFDVFLPFPALMLSDAPRPYWYLTKKDHVQRNKLLLEEKHLFFN